MDYDYKERVGHGEQHPDIDHFDISGAGQISRYPNEAEIIYGDINSDILRYLLCGEDQEEGGVDLDENIEI